MYHCTRQPLPPRFEILLATLSPLLSFQMMFSSVLLFAFAFIFASASISELSPLPQRTIAHAQNTSAHILLSSEGSYAWQFFPYQEQRRLLVVLSTRYNKTIIWIANRNHPVSPNATLHSDASGNLRLLDRDGSIAWSTNVSGGIRRIKLLEEGNLIMNDSKSTVVWQSYDDPTDTLVPGQRLLTNHSMISSTSWDNFSEGNYVLKAEPGGAVLYANFYQRNIPYGVLDYDGTQNFSRALYSACNHTTILYTENGTGVDLVQEGGAETPECMAELGGIDSHSINFGTRLGGEGFRFLKLDTDGDIRSYFQSSSGLVVDNDLFLGYFDDDCKLPGYCGQNSLCSQSICSCPSSFQPINPSDPRQGCSPVLPLNCSKATQSDHLLLELQGVDYYANAYTTPLAVQGVDGCKSLCLSNCSCIAAFFSNKTNACNHYQQIETMQYGSNPSVTAFLKVVGVSLSPHRRVSKHVLVGSIVGACAVFLCLLLAVGWIVRRIVTVEPSEDDAFLESLPGLPPRFSYKEVHRATQGFTKQLGAGASGSVYEGAFSDESVVAVKRLEAAESRASSSRQFRAEVATLGSVNHVNLVQLRGFCAAGIHRLLIYEYMQNGSLDRWIFRERMQGEGNDIQGGPLPWQVRYTIAVDTARGLAFLHEESRDRVVHLDVKPQNILLDGNFRAKLADFGLSKLLERGRSQTVTAMRGTPGYMAPEWFLNMPVTDRSDVFSYGMVLLELAGGRKNLNLAMATEEWYFPAWAVKQAEQGKVMEVLDKQLKCMEGEDNENTGAKEKMKKLIDIAFWCIQEDPSTRPAMSMVLLMLEEHVQVPEPPLATAYVLKRHSRPQPQSSTTSSGTSLLGAAAGAATVSSAGAYSSSSLPTSVHTQSKHGGKSAPSISE